MKVLLDILYDKNSETSCLSEKQYEPFYNALVTVFNPKSVADMGCRVGHIISLFHKNRASDILGVDYFEWNKEAAASRIQDFFIIGDLRDKLDIEKKYDLVISTEVGEHIDSSHVTTYLDNLKSALNDSGNLVISWSPQLDPQHLNPLSKKDFFDLMTRHGFDFNSNLTDSLIQECENNGVFNTFFWYKTGNLSVWKIK
jgi:cyclopropane fatty-acyl-phospholipid synthase-like methyltransferase